MRGGKEEREVRVDEGEGLEECQKVMKRMRGGEEKSKIIRWMRKKDWKRVIK
jgi:hypothetical protein